MHDTMLRIGWDVILLGVSLASMLSIGVFRPDELFAAPKQTHWQKQAAWELDDDGEPILRGPDTKAVEQSQGDVSGSHSPPSKRVSNPGVSTE